MARKKQAAVDFGRVQPPGFGESFTVAVMVNGESVGFLERLGGTRSWGCGTELEEAFPSLRCSDGYKLPALKREVRKAVRKSIGATVAVDTDEALVREGIACGFLPPDQLEYMRSMDACNKGWW